MAVGTAGSKRKFTIHQLVYWKHQTCTKSSSNNNSLMRKMSMVAISIAQHELTQVTSKQLPDIFREELGNTDNLCAVRYITLIFN